MSKKKRRRKHPKRTKLEKKRWYLKQAFLEIYGPGIEQKLGYIDKELINLMVDGLLDSSTTPPPP